MWEDGVGSHKLGSFEHEGGVTSKSFGKLGKEIEQGVKSSTAVIRILEALRMCVGQKEVLVIQELFGEKILIQNLWVAPNGGDGNFLVVAESSRKTENRGIVSRSNGGKVVLWEVFACQTSQENISVLAQIFIVVYMSADPVSLLQFPRKFSIFAAAQNGKDVHLVPFVAKPEFLPSFGPVLLLQARDETILRAFTFQAPLPVFKLEKFLFALFKELLALGNLVSLALVLAPLLADLQLADFSFVPYQGLVALENFFDLAFVLAPGFPGIALDKGINELHRRHPLAFVVR